jgi:hypothetical protein
VRKKAQVNQIFSTGRLLGLPLGTIVLGLLVITLYPYFAVRLAIMLLVAIVGQLSKEMSSCAGK